MNFKKSRDKFLARENIDETHDSLAFALFKHIWMTKQQSFLGDVLWMKDHMISLGLMSVHLNKIPLDSKGFGRP